MSTTDLALTQRGIEQSKCVGKYLASVIDREKPIYVFCSLLRRTRETADYFIRQLAEDGLGGCEVKPLDYVHEMKLGVLEGLTWEERENLYPDIRIDTGLSHAVIPGGESYQDVKARCLKFIDEILSEVDNSATVLLFTHGITLRVFTNVLLGRPDDDVDRLNWVDNTGIAEIEYDAERKVGVPVRINDSSHLGELAAERFETWGLFCDEAY